MVEKCGGLGFGGWLCGWFGHELFGFGEGLGGGDFGGGFVDVVDVEGRVEEENCGAGFGAGALGLVDVLGGKVAVVAVGEENGLFAFHGDFEQAGEWDGAFAGGVPVPGDDAAGGEFHFDDGRAFAGIAFQDSESGAIGDAGDGGEFCGYAFGDDGGVWRFLSGCGGHDGSQQKCGEKNCFHEGLRLVSGYVSCFSGGVSMEIAEGRRFREW